MSEELLSYYNRELAYIRTLAADFARVNPGVAERLGISQQPGDAKDPHVERLIEAFAYLTGRIRRKLHDDFPELVEGLLGMLYPHLLAPIPSMAIAQVRLQQTQTELVGGYLVPAGSEVETPVTTGANAGKICRYRTVYPVRVWPIEVASARMGALPLGPTPGLSSPAATALVIELRCFGAQTFSKLDMPVLRFYLAGLDQHALPLYETILNNTVEVAVGGAPRPTFLGRRALREVGFNADESLLPYGGQTFAGYRILAEYFAFPRKFLFFDVVLPPAALEGRGNRLQLQLYLNRANPELERVVADDTFRLGCTPIINLFSKLADPAKLDETRSEYPIEPDWRNRSAHEVYSVDRVLVGTPGARPVPCTPFYALSRRGADHSANSGLYWYARRRASGRMTDAGIDRGTDVYLSLVDLNFERPPGPGRTLTAELTCLNRDLPQQLPRGGGQPRLTLVSGGPVDLEALTQPTPTVRKQLESGAMWRLISHLNLNYVSISGGEQGAEALREILRLYNFAESVEAEARIAGILEVNSKLVTRRAGGVSAGGVARGLEVNVRFDEEQFPDRGVYLFASVLERFAALYCSINSFTEVVATSRQRDGVLKRWPPRAGEQVLL